MVENFVSYWTESSATGKMRWEAEKYFDMPRRLAVSARLGYGEPTFTPPSIGEIREYANARSMPEQWAMDFYAHYKAIGWMVGKTRMVDWKPKLASWCTQQQQRTQL